MKLYVYRNRRDGRKGMSRPCPACMAAIKEKKMKELKETAVNFIEGDDYITYFTSQRKYINKLLKQAEKYPDSVKITVKNEDGSIVAHLPLKWFKAPTPPKQVSESQKMAAFERFKQYHKSKEN